MSDSIVLLCPGQGAQKVGMGLAWRERSEAARQVFDRADALLGEMEGVSLPATLSSLCWEGPEQTLNRTDVSQVAIFVTSVASWHGLLEGWNMTPADPKLAGAAGLSLGEYTALHLGGAISFEDALRLVALRGRAMQDASEAQGGGMVAIVGGDEEQARAICDEARGDGVLVCANFNAPGQVVLSGSKDACTRALEVASQRGLRATELPVAGAFHSPLMQPAADRLREALDRVEISPARCPVLSNVTGTPHEADPDEIRRRLIEQLTWPVRWAQCCQWMISHLEGAFHELAPGRTLAGLMRRIDRGCRVTAHDEPADES